MADTTSRPAVSAVEVDGFAGLRLSAGDGALSATFLHGLGMVCCSLCHEGDELLAQLKGPAAYALKGSTFALPVLHPWANRLSAWSYAAAGRQVTLTDHTAGIHIDSRSGMPMHGLVAGYRGWRLVDSGVDGDAPWLSAELDFDQTSDLLTGFPYPHRLTLTASVRGATLHIEASLTATGAAHVPVAFGFHPYLVLPGSDRSEWELTLPVRRRMTLDAASGLPAGPSVAVDAAELSGPLGSRDFDDCYDELDPDGAFVMADTRRRIAVAFGDRFTVAQVFAPSEKQFVCFEPMTAPVDALITGEGLRTVAPGDSFSATFTIAVSPS